MTAPATALPQRLRPLRAHPEPYWPYPGCSVFAGLTSVAELVSVTELTSPTVVSPHSKAGFALMLRAFGTIHRLIAVRVAAGGAGA